MSIAEMRAQIQSGIQLLKNIFRQKIFAQQQLITAIGTTSTGNER